MITQNQAQNSQSSTLDLTPPFERSYQLRAEHHRAAAGFLGMWCYEDNHYLDIEAFGLTVLSPDFSVAQRVLEGLEAAGIVTASNEEAATFSMAEFHPYGRIREVFEKDHLIDTYDAFEFAATFDLGNAELAAKYANIDDVRTLRELTPWRPFNVETHQGGFLEFSHALGCCTHSQPFVEISMAVAEDRSTGLWSILNLDLTDPKTGIAAQIEQDRTRIIDAIERRDPDGARRAMQIHNDRIRDFLFEVVPPRGIALA